jgi:hypothetical protein
MKLSLKVMVDGRYNSTGAGMEIPELFRECFEPIDACDDEFIAIAVGGVSHKTAKIVMKTREDAAEILAKELANMIVFEMKKNDTKNGYKDEK